MTSTTCQQCKRAALHARRHGNDTTYVSCRAHRVRDIVRDHFSEFANPNNPRAALRAVPSPDALLGTGIGDRIIIEVFPGIVRVDLDEKIIQNAYPVRVATPHWGGPSFSDEYEERSLAVLYSVDGKYLLDEGPAAREDAGLISLAVSAHPIHDSFQGTGTGMQCASIDTCQAYCTTREPDNSRIVVGVGDILPAFRQRRQCRHCEVD